MNKIGVLLLVAGSYLLISQVGLFVYPLPMFVYMNFGYVGFIIYLVASVILIAFGIKKIIRG